MKTTAEAIPNLVTLGSVHQQPQRRRLLLCTYGFPPSMGPRGLRLLQLSRELAERGWEVDVLTARQSQSHLLYDSSFTEKSIPPGVRVFRTYPGPFYERVQRRLKRRNRVTHAEIHAQISRKRLPFNMDAILRALAIPDIMVEWLPFALLQGHRLLKDNSHDLILSAGLPFTGHLLGYLLTLIHKLPWIAEYGDPWAFNPSSRLPRWRHSLDRHLEDKLLRHANGVVVTTENTREAYLEHYSFLRANDVSVVASGYAPEEYARIPAVTSTQFRIVYTGVFYADIRSPGAFLNAVTQLRDLEMEVVIAGPANVQLQEAVRNTGLHNVHLLGNVPNPQAIALQKGCSMLLLIGNATSYQLPLKTFEYIGAKRPILCIRNGENDLVANLVESLKRGIVVENRPECIAAAIRGAHDLWKRGRLEEQFNLGDLEEFSWCNAGAKLDNILSDVT